MSRLISLFCIILGLLGLVSGIKEVARFGFLLSPRGDPSQLNGGLAPLVIIISIVFLLYGVIQIYIDSK